jgi:hypothetical protein
MKMPNQGNFICYTPSNKVGGGGGILDSACPSVRPSVCLSSMFCFPDMFWINFADNETKLGMIIYNDELQIKFEFRHYWSMLDQVIALGLRIFMKISVFQIFFELILQILK